jgi:hypothetical protein
MDSATRAVLDAMLQEQMQYREEVRMFDSHLFKVLLTYVTGLIAAFGWLGTQVLRRSADLVDRGLVAGGDSGSGLGKAVTQVFGELTQGSFFYLFTGVPVITAILFLVVARDWASLNEKFNHLRIVSFNVAALLEKASDEKPPTVFKLDRGESVQGRGTRTAVETFLFVFWFGVALLLSGIILGHVQAYADSTVRKLWFFGAGWGGLLLGFTGLAIAARAFFKRDYREDAAPPGSRTDSTLSTGSRATRDPDK